MISFHDPLWLILFVLLFLVRWLHRFRQQSMTFPTTTLFLWRTIQHHKSSDGTLSKPDPRWLLRALFISLLILSLAEPSLQTNNRPSIEVWLDDSLSMFVQEEKQQRIQSAILELQRYLLETDPSSIQINSLGNPASQLRLDPDDSASWPALLNEWTSQPRGEASPPQPSILSPYNTHVLLTDGADIKLNEWAQSVPLQYVIQVGSKTQNIALTRLSLRQHLNQYDHINGLARIDNLGESFQKVQLKLLHDEQIIDVQMHDLPPSGKTITTFNIPAKMQNNIYARVESVNDPLSLDDSLRIESNTLKPLLRYEKQGSCNKNITAVIESHPALIQDKEHADLIIDCSGNTEEDNLPTLRFHPPRSTQQTTQPAHWHDNHTLEPLHITAGVPYNYDTPALNSGAIPLLSADGRMLILKQNEDSQIIDIYLDSSDPVFTRYPEYPLMIFSLITKATGRNLDISPLTVTREINASSITPFSLSGISASAVEIQTTKISFTDFLLLASLLVILLDAGLFRRLRNQHT